MECPEDPMEAALTEELSSLRQQLSEVQARLVELEGPIGDPVDDDIADLRFEQVSDAAKPLGIEVAEVDCVARPCLFRVQGPGKAPEEFDEAVDALVESLRDRSVAAIMCTTAYPTGAPPEAAVAVMADDATELNPSGWTPMSRRCNDMLGAF